MLAFALFFLSPGIKNDTIAHYCAYLSNCILLYILISEKAKKGGTRENKGQFGCKTPSPTSLKERYIALMRAIVYDTFGGPDVLHLREVALPEPGPGQVRVAIYAAGTNPVDAGNRQDGSWAGLHPPVIPGSDASGVIDVVGPGVTRFAPGDEVFYMVDFLNNSRGTYAEYHVVDAALIACKPKILTYVEAAALPLAAGTAYETIVRRLALTQGEWVLMYGAAGGVGMLALQMAVAQGAQVIAVARAQHHALLQELGAVACLDYTTQDVLAEAQAIVGRKLDAVADFVGGETLAQSLGVIRPYGRAASTAGVRGDLDRMLDLNLTFHGILVRPEQTRLEALDMLVSTGALCPIVDQVLPLEEAAQAHRRLESGHGQGKVVLWVREQVIPKTPISRLL
jgi:NADPH2:quinone reductase